MKEWIYGRNAVYECLRARRREVFRLRIAQGAQEKGRLVDILQLAATRKLLVERVPRPQLDNLTEHHQGVVLETSAYPYSSLQEVLAYSNQRQQAPFVLILDTLQDPQNLGTLLRTAEAVGIHGVLLPFRHTATITPAVVNASSGASEHLRVVQLNLAQAISELKEDGLWVIGLEGGPEAQPVGKLRLDGPLALVVGSEAEGMRHLIRESCDALLALPMQGQVASLNAAVAGSVVLYLALQARNKEAAENRD